MYFWGHGLKLICAFQDETNLVTFIAESNNKLFCIVVWDEKFRRNISDDDLTNSNAEAVGVFSRATAGSVFKCLFDMDNNSCSFLLLWRLEASSQARIWYPV